MDIKKYERHFHDGSIFAIQHTGNTVILSMESAEMDEEDKVDDVVLSMEDNIHGKLHIEGVRSIVDEALGILEHFELRTMYATIFDLEIGENTVELQLIWETIPFVKDDFSVIKIEAEKIWWENLPDTVGDWWLEERQGDQKNPRFVTDVKELEIPELGSLNLSEDQISCIASMVKKLGTKKMADIEWMLNISAYICSILKPRICSDLFTAEDIDILKLASQRCKDSNFVFKVQVGLEVRVFFLRAGRTAGKMWNAIKMLTQFLKLKEIYPTTWKAIYSKVHLSGDHWEEALEWITTILPSQELDDQMLMNIFHAFADEPVVDGEAHLLEHVTKFIASCGEVVGGLKYNRIWAENVLMQTWISEVLKERLREIMQESVTIQTSGQGGRGHYHRLNPHATSRHDMYLDRNRNPVSKHSQASRLYAR